MNAISLILISCNCISQGRRVNGVPATVADEHPSWNPSYLPTQVNAIAALLLGFSPAAAGTRRGRTISASNTIAAPLLPCQESDSIKAVHYVQRAARTVPSMKLLGGQQMSRRLFASTVAAAIGAPMLPASALGPSSLSGKPRPDIGVVLLEPAQKNGKLVSADVVCDGGIVASVAWESSLNLAKGNYYDLEVNNQAQDVIYVQVAELPNGKALDAVPADFFRKEIFSSTGRWSSYGTPDENAITDKGMSGSVRFFDLEFEVLKPNGLGLPRLGFGAAVQPKGSSSAIMVIGTTTDYRWQGEKGDIRRAVESFQVSKTRPSKLPRKFDSDYRYSGKSAIEEDGLVISNTVAQQRARATKAGSLSAGGRFSP